MSLSSTNSRNDYVGAGNTDTYDYTFKIFNESDLTVTVLDTGGTTTTLVLDTDYTVSGEGLSAGGSIVLLDGNLTTGYILTIRRLVDLTQDTEIRNQGAFYPVTHEDAFDKFVMIDQQQQDEIDRSVKLHASVPATDFDPTLPSDIADYANATIIVNATGDGWEMGPTASDSASAVAAAASAALVLAEQTYEASFTNTTPVPSLTSRRQIHTYTGTSAQTFAGLSVALASLATGGMFIFVGSSDTNTLTFETSDGTNGWLTNGSFELGRGSVIVFIYNSTLGRLVEMSRSA